MITYNQGSTPVAIQENEEGEQDALILADLLSRVYFYGNFKPETPNEKLIEILLTKMGLWPTTESDILKRKDISDYLKVIEKEEKSRILS